MSNSAYVTHSAVWNADDGVVERVKLATLLFDRIQWSVSTPLAFARATTSAASEPALANSTISELSQCWIGHPSDLPMYNIWNIDGGFEGVLDPDQYPELLSATKSALLGDGLDPDGQYDDYKLALYTMTEILYWRKYLPSKTFIGHHFSDQALHNYAIAATDRPPSQEVKTPSPSLFDLSWNDIVSLRRSPYLTSFRSKYVELSIAGKVDELFDRYQNALESLADEVRPAPIRNTVIGVLSNLPTPTIVNPISVASSIHTVYTDRRRAKTYGWAFFVREARALNDARDSQ